MKPFISVLGNNVFPMRNSSRVKFIENLVCSWPRTYLKCFTWISLNLVATLRMVVISIYQMKTLRHCKFKSLAYAAAAAVAAKSLQSCTTLCDPIDGSPPGSSVHGIFQARALEWSAIAFSTLACGHHSNNWQTWDSNPGNLRPEIAFPAI